jgi:hypothetical protein
MEDSISQDKRLKSEAGTSQAKDRFRVLMM